MKLGKKPATYDRRDLLFADYADVERILAAPPKAFGHDAKLNKALRYDWGMLGNDFAGDCVWAEAAHTTMVWNYAAGKTVRFDTDSVISDYSKVTGYNPRDPSTDQGTDMRAAMRYRQKTGVVDADGQRHKIGAYASIEPGNWDHLIAALYLFECVPVGIRFPRSAMDQFNAGKPWSRVVGSPIEGGHDVPLVGRHGLTDLVTWGKRIGATKPFLMEYIDEAWAILSPEMLTNGVSAEHFNVAQLTADLAAL